jgi:toxin-antitoxin system PIN domain toxin
LIALDTNILVYARREETQFHSQARSLLKRLAEGFEPWAIPWPCVYEFLRVVTHPRVFDPPSNIEVVVDDLSILMRSPSLTMLGEGPAHWSHLRRTVVGGRVIGNLVHDAHIAGLCLEHGVSVLFTEDRDFHRFPGLETVSPFESSTGE